MADVEGSPGVWPPVIRGTTNEGTGAVTPATRAVLWVFRVNTLKSSGEELPPPSREEEVCQGE